MTPTITNLPQTIQSRLDGYSTTGENHKTCSSSGVFFFEHPNKPALYLKSLRPSEAPREATLYAESTAVEWLQGKVPVPQLVAYCCEDEVEYMLTTQVSGYPAYSAEATVDMPGLVALLARGLREIHGIPYQGCPLDNRASSIIQSVTEWLKGGIMEISDLPEQLRKATLDESISELLQLQPDSEDLVFTHGDYCLPNILVNDGQITGYIDLGYAGIADRYCDFVCIDYTIRRNLGDEWVEPFWDAYGVEIDPVKFDLYQLLHWII